MNATTGLDTNNKRLVDIIRELSIYGLGICLPHSHDSNGNMEPLPDDQLALEINLSVSFVRVSDLDKFNAIPVAWRWLNGGVQVSAACCKKTNHLDYQNN